MKRLLHRFQPDLQALFQLGSQIALALAFLSVLVSYSGFWTAELPCMSCSVLGSYSRFRAASNSAHGARISQSGPPRSPRSPRIPGVADTPPGELFPRPPASPALNGGAAGEAPLLSGVDGDIKQAFGKQAAPSNLRDDLLVAADNVTNAMFTLVKELNSDIPAEQEMGFLNGDSDTADLEALERQVNQIRQSLGTDDDMQQGHVNGDVAIPDVSTKVISHGREKKAPTGKLGLGRSRRPDGERTDPDTDDDEIFMRNGNYNYKFPVRTPMTDDESYIQTDDDEGTGRTDDEDQEWQDSMRRWANR